MKIKEPKRSKRALDAKLGIPKPHAHLCLIWGLETPNLEIQIKMVFLDKTEIFRGVPELRGTGLIKRKEKRRQLRRSTDGWTLKSIRSETS